jgi:hypothetical protein
MSRTMAYCVQAEVFVDSAEGWVTLIQNSVQAATLAEAARGELRYLPWETRLLDRLDVERERLHLDLDRGSFRLTGAVGSATISVRLAVEEARYALLYRLQFAPPLPKGEGLTSRAPRSLFQRLLQLGRSKTNGAWEAAIEASPLVRARLSTAQLARIASLSALGTRGHRRQ